VAYEATRTEVESLHAFAGVGESTVLLTESTVDTISHHRVRK
jgi:hypothetical protein